MARGHASVDIHTGAIYALPHLRSLHVKTPSVLNTCSQVFVRMLSLPRASAEAMHVYVLLRLLHTACKLQVWLKTTPRMLLHFVMRRAVAFIPAVLDQSLTIEIPASNAVEI